MQPTILDGSVVVVLTLGFFLKKLTVGDIVLFRRNKTIFVKRIISIDDGGRYYLKGDNPQDSLDSRDFGLVTKSEIIGKVLFKQTK